MVASDILNVFENVTFDESISKYEFHAYQPYSSTTFDYNDEISININRNDVFTLPADSFLYIEGKFKTDKATETPAILTNNPYPYLFSEIKYYLNGIEVDHVRNPGYTSTIKGYASLSKPEMDVLTTSGWHMATTSTPTLHTDYVNACIPLKHLLGFAEDYNKVIFNAKQELILLRSRNDDNLYKGSKSTFTLTRIAWHVPHIQPSDEIKTKLYKNMHRDVFIPFRKWELHMLPSLKSNTIEKWAVRTSSYTEKPLYVIVALQTNRMDNREQDATKFDAAKIRNIQLFLNTNVYPYLKYNLNVEGGQYSLAYFDYIKFQQNYYNRQSDPVISFANYKNNPIFILDCSHQDETVKSSSVDVQIELEATANFPEKTSVFCLIIHDTIFRYNPVTGDVRRES